MERQEKEKNAEGVVNPNLGSESVAGSHLLIEWTADIVPLQSAPMSDPTSVPAVPTNAQDENHSVVRAAGLIGIATFSSRILGFIRDMVLARLFGATPAADAFFVAYRVPNLLRELFAEGSMSSAFIPVFTEYQTLKTKRDAWELGQRDVHHAADDRDGRHGARHRGGAGDRLAAGAGISRRPRQVGAHDVPHPNHVAISPVHQSRRPGHGHPELYARIRRPRIFAGVFQYLHHRMRFVPLSPHAPSDHRGGRSASWLEAQRSLRCNSRD